MLNWQQSPFPTLVRNTTSVDAVRAAVGLRHAALVTRTGELYTWGYGKSEYAAHPPPSHVSHRTPPECDNRDRGWGESGLCKE
eukprot:355959-Chlamydomonas_euryale.AAC.2